ncbi:MAG TPA: MFS transporter, partial [Atopostipes sp.]|nr:MFS transporter [Atopostipes sp.]
MEKSLNWKYSAIHFTSSALMAVTIAYASVYLLEKGFLNATIGAVLAVSSLLSIGLQTLLADYIDNHKEVTLQSVLIQMSLIIIASSALLYFMKNGFIVLVLVTIIYSLVRTAAPFINSLAFIYDKYNIRVKYGVARGLASIAYAITTMLLGQVLGLVNPSLLPIFYVVFAVFGLIAIWSYRLPESFEEEQVIAESQFEETLGGAIIEEFEKPAEKSVEEDHLSFGAFLLKYRRLVLLIVGVIFLLFSQTLVSYFFIQILKPIGGDNSSMGIAIFIAAGIEFPVIMRFDWLAEKRSIEFWLKVSIIFYIVKNVLTFLATNMYMIYFAQFLQFGAFALAFPALVNYINVIVEPKDLVKGQTLLTLGMSIGSVFASFLGGILIDSIGVS